MLIGPNAEANIDLILEIRQPAYPLEAFFYPCVEEIFFPDLETKR
jgi:hypothetical protein